MGILKKIAVACAAALTLLLAASAQGEAPEYQVKAAMLYKFAVFVEWPPQAFPAGTSPFVTCVLGQDPFGKWLQQEMGEARVGTHPVEIRHPAPGESSEGCHMVFVADSETAGLPQIMARLHKTTALIVSDISDAGAFCRLGGMICLVNEGDRVRFELNATAIAKAGLKIDSRLKRVALSTDCGKTK